MNTEFTREERYIVFKLSDVERFLTDADRTHLAMMKNEIDAGRDCANKPPFKGLIVESDWPEYDLVWDMIESRMTKGQNHPEDDSLIEDIKLCMDMADGGEDSDPEEAAFFASILARIRRLEGEKKLLKEKLAEINGPTHMGEPAQPAPSINEGVRKVTLDFRWESEAQHYIPTIEIEFDPVSPGSPNDAKSWQDRYRLAAMLTPEAKP